MILCIELIKKKITSILGINLTFVFVFFLINFLPSLLLPQILTNNCVVVSLLSLAKIKKCDSEVDELDI